MKCGLIIICSVIVLSIFLLAFVPAEEQVQTQDKALIQTYSGFERFADGVKLFFSFGDDKVRMALEIREKEVNSAINNLQNEDGKEVAKNLERARERLQLVQEKVSVEMADDVKISVDGVLNRIREQENLPEDFELYVLEEQKAGLIADLVVEVDGKEGQTLKREVVRNESSGDRQIVVVVDGAEGQTKTLGIQKQIGETSNNITNWVVEHTYAEGTTAGGESGVVIEGGEAIRTGSGGKMLETEVVSGGHLKNDPLPEPDLNKINPDLYDPNARAPGDTIDETYDDDTLEVDDGGDYAEGTTASGILDDATGVEA